MKHQDRHLDDGALMAYRDHELGAEDRSLTQMHLAGCEVCQSRLAVLTAQAEQVGGLLRRLDPTPLDAPHAGRALAALRPYSNDRSTQTMLDRIRASKRLQRALIGVASLVVVIGLFSLAPVRALAAEFLGLFRVEHFVTIPVTAERIEQLSQVMEQSMGFGEVVTAGEQGTQVASLDDAAAQVGFAPLVPDGYGDPFSVMVNPTQTADFTPDVAMIREVFAAMDLDPMLIPDNIDGKEFTFTFPAGVMAMYNVAPETTFSVVQMPSPTVDGPEDVDLQQLGVALLQLLGMSPEEAERLSASIDWTSTAVLPIPQNAASAREVEVRGTPALAIEASDEGDPDDGNHLEGGGGVLWQQDGYIFAVGSDTIDTPGLIAIAESLR